MNDALKNILVKIEQQIKDSLTCSEQWEKDSFGRTFSATKDEHFMQLISPAADLVNLGGKRWRPLLLVLTAQAVCENNENLSKEQAAGIIENAYHLTPLVESVHTASLIHDDIEDCSTERRGKPAAYLTYGTDVALNSGSWLYFQASKCINSLNADDDTKLKLYQCYCEELRRLHLGQAMDIYWHRTPELFPSVDEYMAMVQYKTGTLSSLSCKTGGIAAGMPAEDVSLLGRTAALTGAGFQIIDDVINLTSGNPGKKRGDDIVEGKKSLPVLMFVQSADQKSRIQLEDCFVRARKEGIDSPAVEEAVGLMEKSGSISLAREKGITLIEDCCRELTLLTGKNEWSALITELFLSMIPGYADYKESKKKNCNEKHSN